MTPNTLPIAAALLAAVSLSSAPAFAGQQNQDRGRRDAPATSGNRDHATERAQPRSDAQRAEPSREAQRPQPNRETQRAQPNREAQRPQPNRENVSPRGDTRHENVAPRAVPRYEPRYAPRYEPRYEARGSRPIIVAPRYNGYGYGYAPRYYRPYVFRPRFSIGFGIFAGYPVPYSYSYPYPIPVYGYSAPRGEVMVGPGSNQYGGVSLEITPSDALVYVDGNYAGEVRDFDGTQQPLTLAYGTHRIDVQAPGYETLTFDVAVQAGQVIPYRGDLLPSR